jgi:hypothetical protein
MRVPLDGTVDPRPLLAAQDYALRAGWAKEKASAADFIDASFAPDRAHGR